jgi:PAS domain-containing protein
MAANRFVSRGVADERGKDAAHSPTGGLAEATIDMGSLFTQDVSLSGSFDLRRFRLSSIGKLLEAIPIPTLLVDECLQIAFANGAVSNLLPNDVDVEGSRFAELFASAHDGENGEQLIKSVLAQRIPLVAEVFLGPAPDRILGRIHLRPVRLQKVRYTLAVVEDVRPLRERLQED